MRIKSMTLRLHIFVWLGLWFSKFRVKRLLYKALFNLRLEHTIGQQFLYVWL